MDKKLVEQMTRVAEEFSELNKTVFLIYAALCAGLTSQAKRTLTEVLNGPLGDEINAIINKRSKQKYDQFDRYES